MCQAGSGSAGALTCGSSCRRRPGHWAASQAASSSASAFSRACASLCRRRPGQWAASHPAFSSVSTRLRAKPRVNRCSPCKRARRKAAPGAQQLAGRLARRVGDACVQLGAVQVLFWAHSKHGQHMLAELQAGPLAR